MSTFNVYMHGKFNEVKDLLVYKNGTFVSKKAVYVMINGEWIKVL